jgi:hypothetical protein
MRDQEGKGVVHRLQGDGPDLGPDRVGHGVGGNVGLTRYCPKNRQSLGRNLDTPLPKQICRVEGHGQMLSQIID